MITRRRALAGIIAAPAIVRIASIMPVRVPPLVVPSYDALTAEAIQVIRMARVLAQRWAPL